MGLLELCEKYFQTKNLYEVLQISENATEKEVKKAYHKLSLQVHPDRVKDDEKLDATEKFKVLGGVHAILSDKDKKELYDATKSVDEEEYNVMIDKDWTIYWRILFKKITEEDIKKYENEYIGSEEEKKDLKNAYLTGKGDMDYIVDQVQFARSEHEPRFRTILTEMIEKGDIPAYDIFINEPAKKRKRRHAKEKREAKEAEEFENTVGFNSGGNSLEQMIKQNREARIKTMDTFLDDLAARYTPKSRGTKRRAASKSETTKTKRKKS